MRNILAAGSLGTLALMLVAAPLFAFAHTSSTKSAGLSVAIDDSGGVLVRGAEVTAISDGTITARTSWGDTSITWTVDTGADTDFVDVRGEGSNYADISIGDTISFTGPIDTDAGAFSVDANVVKNWSEGEPKESRAEVKAQGFWKNWGTKFFGGMNWGHR